MMYTNLRKESKMTNTRKITYTTHMGGKAVYAGITKADTDFVLEVLEQGLYAMLERSNYDQIVKQAIHLQDQRFRKQTEVSNKTNNSLVSFLAGVLTQHLNARKLGKKKDFSTKQLPGIKLATQCFNDMDKKFPVIEFEDALAPTKVTAKNNNSTIGKLFDHA